MGVRSRLAAAAAVLPILLACSADANALGGCPNDGTEATVATGAQAAAALVCDINVVRARNGLAALQWSDKLAGAAQPFAQDLTAQQLLSHIASDGRTVSDRVFATGYFDGAEASLVAENVGWGNYAYSTPLAIVLGWMQSAPHRANLLDPQAAEIGVGIAPGQVTDLGTNGFFYVADFAARDNTASAPTSSTTTVGHRTCTARERRALSRKRRAFLRKRHTVLLSRCGAWLGSRP